MCQITPSVIFAPCVDIQTKEQKTDQESEDRFVGLLDDHLESAGHCSGMIMNVGSRAKQLLNE